MNLSYSENFCQRYADFGYYPTMQLMPPLQPIFSHKKLKYAPPSLYTPYNHFPQLNVPSIFSGLRSQYGGEYKSAFKRVTEKQSNRACTTNTVSVTTTKMSPSEQKNYNTKYFATVSSTTNGNDYGQSEISSCYNPRMRLDLYSSKFIKQNQQGDNYRTQKPDTENQQTINDNSTESVYKWNTLLPIVPKAMKQLEVITGVSSFDRVTGQSDEESKDFIDLTKSENIADIEDIEDNIPSSIIKFNVITKSENIEETLVEASKPLEKAKQRKPRAKKTIKSDQQNDGMSEKKKSVKQRKKSITKKDPIEKSLKRKKSISTEEHTETPSKRVKSPESNKQNEKPPNKKTIKTIENQTVHVQTSKLNQSPLQENAVASTTSDKKSVCTLLENCLTNEQEKTSQDEDDCFTNKNQSMRRYFRRYNGFRLFARINYAKARELAEHQNSGPNVQSILLSWWSSMSPVAKEKFIQIADIQNMSQNEKQTENNERTNAQTLSIANY